MIPFGYYFDDRKWFLLTFWDDGTFVWSGDDGYNLASKDDRERDVRGMLGWIKNNKQVRSAEYAVVGWRI